MINNNNSTKMTGEIMNNINIIKIREEIMEYIKNNNIYEIKFLLIKYGLNVINNKNFDILIYSLENNSSQEMIKFFISLYNSLNYTIFDVTKNKYISPLLSALFNNNNISIIQLLIENGADKNYIFHNQNTTQLYIINNIDFTREKLKFMIDNKFDVNYIINVLIERKQYAFINYVFKYYIYNNKAIINFIIAYKNYKKETIMINQKLDSVKSITSNENNDIINNDLTIINLRALNKEIKTKFYNKINSINSEEKGKIIVQFNWLDEVVENIEIFNLLYQYLDENTKQKYITSIFQNNKFNSFKLLMSYNLNIDVNSEDAISFFINAVTKSKKDIIEYFIESKIEINNKICITPRIILSILDLDIPELYDIITNNEYKDEEYYPCPLIKAIEKQNEIVVKYLIDNKIETRYYRKNPLVEAIKKKNEYITKYIMNHHGKCIKSDIRLVDFSPLTIAIVMKKKNIIKDLIKNGADVNENDGFHNFPLIYALYWNDYEIVKYLIDNGANVNQYGYNGTHPITIANSKGNTDIINLLKSKGCNKIKKT